MTIAHRIARFFVGGIASDEAFTLDHVPVNGAADWREEKVKAASARFGKPFLCGPDSVPREVIVDGKVTTLKPGERAKATVTPIGAKKARKS